MTSANIDRTHAPDAAGPAAGGHAAAARADPVAAPDLMRQPPLYAEIAVTIRRPRRDVASVMFNPRYDAAWIGGVRRASATAPGPLRKGARVARQWSWFGRAAADTSEVIDFVPDRSLEMTAQFPFAARLRYELEGIPEGTIVRICARAQPEGRLRWFAAALNPLLRMAVSRSLSRLKVLLETGAWRDLAA